MNESLTKPKNENEINISQKDAEMMIETILNPPDPSDTLKMAALYYEEISDPEIYKKAEEFSNSYMNKGVALSSFAQGAQWYREQLKKKQK